MQRVVMYFQNTMVFFKLSLPSWDQLHINLLLTSCQVNGDFAAISEHLEQCSAALPASVLTVHRMCCIYSTALFLCPPVSTSTNVCVYVCACVCVCECVSVGGGVCVCQHVGMQLIETGGCKGGGGT